MLCRRPLSGPTTQIWSRTPRFAWILKGICTQGTDQPYSNRPQIRVSKKIVKIFGKIFGFSKKSIVAKTHVWSQMGIISMIVYFWYVPKGYRKQHFHSLIAILKIGILIELFHNPWNPYYSTVHCRIISMRSGATAVVPCIRILKTNHHESL